MNLQLQFPSPPVSIATDPELQSLISLFAETDQAWRDSVAEHDRELARVNLLRVTRDIAEQALANKLPPGIYSHGAVIVSKVDCRIIHEYLEIGE